MLTVIPLQNLFISFLSIVLLISILALWNLDWKNLLYAKLRMLIQLLLVGYALSFLFQQNNILWTSFITLFMLSVSSWIALHSVKKKRKQYLTTTFISLLIGALPVLLLVTMFVIPTKDWHKASFFIPLAGMVFSNSLNMIGIAAERFSRELETESYELARNAAFKAALIPFVNMLLAISLVSLPGMMTGQILSGVSPLLAVRYQVVVLTMAIGGGGLSTAAFLYINKKQNSPQNMRATD